MERQLASVQTKTHAIPRQPIEKRLEEIDPYSRQARRLVISDVPMQRMKGFRASDRQPADSTLPDHGKNGRIVRKIRCNAILLGLPIGNDRHLVVRRIPHK